MSINLNRVTVTGNLAQEPELLDLPAGMCACELRIACSRRWQHKVSGVWDEWTDFFDARIVGGLAPIAHRRLRTGHGIAIDGRLSSQPSRREDPAHRSETVILVDDIQFLTKATGDNPTAPGLEVLGPGDVPRGALRPGNVLVTDDDELNVTNTKEALTITNGKEPTTTSTPPASVQSMPLQEP